MSKERSTIGENIKKYRNKLAISQDVILNGEEKHLNLRQFDDKTKRKVYEKQKGKCVWRRKLLNSKKWKPII